MLYVKQLRFFAVYRSNFGKFICQISVVLCCLLMKFAKAVVCKSNDSTQVICRIIFTVSDSFLHGRLEFSI